MNKTNEKCEICEEYYSILAFNILFEGMKVCASCSGDLTVIDTRLNFFIKTGKFSSGAQNPNDIYPESFSNDYLNFDHLYSGDDEDWRNAEDHN